MPPFQDLTVNLPFFMSEEETFVPPDNEEAVIVVLDKDGNLVSQVHGSVTEARMNEIIEALQMPCHRLTATAEQRKAKGKMPDSIDHGNGT